MGETLDLTVLGERSCDFRTQKYQVTATYGVSQVDGGAAVREAAKSARFYAAFGMKRIPHKMDRYQREA